MNYTHFCAVDLMPRNPKPGTTSPGRDNLDPVEMAVLKLRMPEAVLNNLSKAATREGMQTAKYAAIHLAKLDQTEALRSLIESSRQPISFLDDHYDQHVQVAYAASHALFQLLEAPIDFNETMLRDFERLTNPIALRTVHATKSIKLASKKFRRALRRFYAEESTERRNHMAHFLITVLYTSYRPLTGNPVPPIPKRYFEDAEYLRMRQEASITYCIVSTEHAMYQERHPPIP